MNKVVLATGNAGKVVEMQSILEEFGLEVVPQSQFDIPEAVEDGLSFVENAIKKARHACELTKLPAIADDSGLEVDALNGEPGIYSARYADGGDAANNEKLLRNLEGIQERNARFQCVLVFMQHALDPTPIICQGSWEGEIALEPKGEGGFGYDPIFFDPSLSQHSAELSAAEKRQHSHRGKALAALQAILRKP